MLWDGIEWVRVGDGVVGQGEDQVVLRGGLGWEQWVGSESGWDRGAEGSYGMG